MRFLLAAVNARYIHSNLGIYSIKAYAAQELMAYQAQFSIELGEYTINHNVDDILRDIYKRQPDVVGFSCYIWNIRYIMELVRDLPKILPDVKIWLGGPEVSYNAEELLLEYEELEGIMMGEGEETFTELIKSYLSKSCPSGSVFHDTTNNLVSCEPIDGLACRCSDGSIRLGKIRPLMDMSRIPFPYRDLEGFENRIIYYESSRGCPFSCSYCLSSIDKSVRFRDVELVKEELGFFLRRNVPQVKFVDRTFNCKKSHAMAIWRYILDHDNGVTNFHFEISADLLGEEELALIAQMRPGLIQLEIGVQTTNPQVVTEIRRTMDLDKLRYVVEQINSFGNIHQHLDLIAGLPFEDYHSFVASFDDVYRMKPEQLQLGFLKVLKGSYMSDMAASYGLKAQCEPPYEVLSTRWLDYGQVIHLKAVEAMVEVYYNSGQFTHTLEKLVEEWGSAYSFYEALAAFYEKNGLDGISHNRIARYEMLFSFITNMLYKSVETYRDLLMYDLYLRENVKSRPSFARDQTAYKTVIRDFFMKEAAKPEYLLGYEGYDSKQISKMAHVEAMEDGTLILFDYKNRNPLSYNAKAVVLHEEKGPTTYGSRAIEVEKHG